jgi:hypothetical protein
LLNFFYTDRILGQAGRKIGESVGSISRGPTPGGLTFRISNVPLASPRPPNTTNSSAKIPFLL